MLWVSHSKVLWGNRRLLFCNLEPSYVKASNLAYPPGMIIYARKECISTSLCTLSSPTLTRYPSVSASPTGRAAPRRPQACGRRVQQPLEELFAPRVLAITDRSAKTLQYRRPTRAGVPSRASSLDHEKASRFLSGNASAWQNTSRGDNLSR